MKLRTFGIGISVSMQVQVDYGIYFNFDVDNKILEICNEPACDDCTSLDDIIEMINDTDDNEE